METIYAYLAGIIDGEGCISIRKCKQGKYIFQNWNNISTRCTPFVYFFMSINRTNLIPNGITKGFSNKFNGWSMCHTNFYHWFKINIFSLFAFSDTDTTLSVYNTCKIGINSFHNYNVSYYIIHCQERRVV